VSGPHRWEDLHPAIRQAVEAHTGAVTRVEPAVAGSVSDFAATLRAERGRFFCKGVAADNPLAWMHRNEARLNPWLPDLAPRHRWTVDAAGWLVIGFDHADGHHPDLSPGSPDLPAVASILTALSRSLPPSPSIPVQRAASRWAGRIEAGLLIGDTLLHTDMSRFNLLLGQRSWVVDWAMPCLGAAWLDPALMIVRLIHAGHTPAQAEAWAKQVPAWENAPHPAVGVFSAALADLWEERQRTLPAPHRGPLAVAARRWARYRHRS
jgi:hypothetical protein